MRFHQNASGSVAGPYDAHIRAEEEIAYPAAQALIAEPGRAAMGEEMMRRRGVK